MTDSRHESIGDRMKLYEGAESDRRFMPLLPILARVDGRCFHSFTRGMDRPYDIMLSKIMEDTTHYLARETNACMGYTQSDEITLAWHSTEIKSQVWFDGRIFKMVSQLAAHATLCFYRLVLEHIPRYQDRLPTFDARAWQVPNRTEGANVFLWREWDATKNSISMAAQEVFSDSELHGRNGKDKQEMLFQKGINWNDYPDQFKRGLFVQRRIVSKPFSSDELEQLPEKHAARRDPSLTVERSEWRSMEMPPFATATNREAVIFEGAEPK